MTPAALEKSIEGVLAFAMRLLANHVDVSDRARALELMADRLKVQAAAQRQLDARRAKR
jgi:hypothetical protein